jgi:hypothetical protein
MSSALLVPRLAWADGTKLTEFTLDPSRDAMLVRILLLNLASHTAKVKILKRYGKLRAVAKHPSELAAQVEVEAEATVDLYQPPKPVPRKWIMETRYWNPSSRYSKGQTAFLVDNNGAYEVVADDAATRAKFDLLYDEAKFATLLATAPSKQLFRMLGDRDFLGGHLKTGQRSTSQNRP